jgi:hypothetical protein
VPLTGRGLVAPLRRTPTGFDAVVVDRMELDIRTIEAFDVTPEQREADNLRKDRERNDKKRRVAGIQTHEEYLAGCKSRTKPWLAAGFNCRSTWERHLKKAKEVDCRNSNPPPYSSHIYKRIRVASRSATKRTTSCLGVIFGRKNAMANNVASKDGRPFASIGKRLEHIQIMMGFGDEGGGVQMAKNIRVTEGQWSGWRSGAKPMRLMYGLRLCDWCEEYLEGVTLDYIYRGKGQSLT